MCLTKGLRILFCIVLVIGVCCVIEPILLAKNDQPVQAIEEFYLQDRDSVDVLVLGSSHVGAGVDLEPFWSRHGISAYTLWGPYQRFEVTYHYFLEALKTQSPKLVILDVNAALFGSFIEDWPKMGNLAGLQYAQMVPSLNKVEAILENTPKEEQLDLILSIPAYHQRYKSLSQRDFDLVPWNGERKNKKGTYYKEPYGSCDPNIDLSLLEGEIPLNPVEGQYLNRIIRLSMERDVPLLLIKTPFCHWNQNAGKINTVRAIAEGYNVPFLDLNLHLDEIGLRSMDYCNDPPDHLNSVGARKTGIFLSDYVTERYDLPDHRGDARYVSWDAFSHEQRRTLLSNKPSMEDVLLDMAYENTAVWVLKNGELPAEQRKWLESLERLDPHLRVADLLIEEYGVWMSPAAGSTPFENVSEGRMSAEIPVNESTFTYDFSDGTMVQWDGVTLLGKGPTGLTLMVFDTRAEKPLYTISFNGENRAVLSRAGY